MASVAFFLSESSSYLKNWYQWVKAFHPTDVFVVDTKTDDVSLRTYMQRPADFDLIGDGTLNHILVLGHGYAGGGTTLEIGRDGDVAAFLRNGLTPKIAAGCTMRIQICDVGNDENIGFVRGLVPVGVTARFPNDLSALLHTAGQSVDLIEDARCGVTDLGTLRWWLNTTIAHDNYQENALKFLRARGTGPAEWYAWLTRLQPVYQAHHSQQVRQLFADDLLSQVPGLEIHARAGRIPEQRDRPQIPPVANFRRTIADRFSAMDKPLREEIYKAAFGGNTGQHVGV